jgi:hypothetical protein
MVGSGQSWKQDATWPRNTIRVESKLEIHLDKPLCRVPSVYHILIMSNDEEGSFHILVLGTGLAESIAAAYALSTGP